MRTNPFYGTEDDNSDVGEIIQFIDRQSHLSAVHKDLFVNRLTQRPTDEELAIARQPQPSADSSQTIAPVPLQSEPVSNHSWWTEFGGGVSWPLPLPAKLSDLAGCEFLSGGTLIEHVEHSEYTAEHGRAKILSIGWNREKGENWFEIATDSDKAWNGVNVKEAGDPDLTIMPDGAIRYQSPFGPCYTLLPKGHVDSAKAPSTNSAQPAVAVESDWRTEEHEGRMHTRCWARNDKGASCISMVKHTGTPHIFCQRWPHEGYCMAACLLPEDASRRGVACHAPAGEYVKATKTGADKPVHMEPLAILSKLRLKCGAVVEREQIVLIDELHAALDRESTRAEMQKLKDQGILEGYQLIRKLIDPIMMASSTATEPAKSLLDICREFDAIDLSECNRRLEAGEKFDAACDEAMEKRQALGEHIKERLGEQFEKFERLYDARQSETAALLATTSLQVAHRCGCGYAGGGRVECDNHRKEQAVRVLGRMIGGAAHGVCAFSPDSAVDIEHARNAHARLGVLLS